jgi:hypothetical protein
MAARKGKVKEEQAVVSLGPQVREGLFNINLIQPSNFLKNNKTMQARMCSA